MTPSFVPACPIPLQQYPQVLLAHGGGGRLMQQLIEQMFLPAFCPPGHIPHDAATFSVSGDRLAFTTDSYVVNPLFFPGGDIGSMAVYGTVNDLAMAGARPLYLSVGFILEEGLPMETLWRIVQSMKRAAQDAEVTIVTGDTKVVNRGKGDGIFINTAGIGVITHEWAIAPTSVQPGDCILLNGDIGRHGIAIMAAREKLEFETPIESDLAPLATPVLALLEAGVEIHCLRDLTRGGLASALNEIAAAAGVAIALNEASIPVQEGVRGACEILGFDPLYVANEGRFVTVVPASDVDKALSILQTTAKASANSAAQAIVPQAIVPRVIGQVSAASFPGGLVSVRNTLGLTRILDMLSGEQLPRIC